MCANFTSTRQNTTKIGTVCRITADVLHVFNVVVVNNRWLMPHWSDSTEQSIRLNKEIQRNDKITGASLAPQVFQMLINMNEEPCLFGDVEQKYYKQEGNRLFCRLTHTQPHFSMVTLLFISIVTKQQWSTYSDLSANLCFLLSGVKLTGKNNFQPEPSN